MFYSELFTKCTNVHTSTWIPSIAYFNSICLNSAVNKICTNSI